MAGCDHHPFWPCAGCRAVVELERASDRPTRHREPFIASHDLAIPRPDLGPDAVTLFAAGDVVPSHLAQFAASGFLVAGGSTSSTQGSPGVVSCSTTGEAQPQEALDIAAPGVAPTDTPPLDTLTKGELVAMATAAGVDLPKRSTREQLIELLRSAGQ